jgi:hypothetical protein
LPAVRPRCWRFSYVFCSFVLGLPAALLIPAHGLLRAFNFRTLTVGARLTMRPKNDFDFDACYFSPVSGLDCPGF